MIKSLSRLNRYMILKQNKKWENTRKKGKKSYVLIYGVLLWGFPVAILGEFFIRISKYGFTLDVFDKDHFFQSMIFRTITFIIVGIFFGLYMWGKMENKYQKSIEKKENDGLIH